jgi:hypothetical protein
MALSAFAVSIPLSPTITKADLTNIRHVPNTAIAQSVAVDPCASTRDKCRAHVTWGIVNVRGSYQESSMSKVRGNDAVAAHRA